MSGPQTWSVLTPVRAVIAEQRKALDELEASLAACERVFTGGAVPSVPTSDGEAASRRSTVAAGSLPDRILGVLRQAGEPVPASALFDGAGADKYAVKVELGRLIEAKRVKKTGLSRGTRYALVK